MTAFYVTTPIYYVNDRPHIGTAYSTIAADVLARFHRLRGEPTRMLTGLDEHGQKLERRAHELGMTPQAFVDSMAAPFREAWQLLRCAHDDFIRTTEARHKERVHELWRRCERQGDIYEDTYEGLYCVGCEAYYTEKDLLPGNLCPTHQKPVEMLKEQTFFFRLSAYTERLLAFYEQNPGFVQPEGRFNEVKAFVREGLRDLSISRGTFSWGVPVERKPEHVVYVWFDALTNYMSALGGPPRAGESAPLFSQFWTPAAQVIHIVGKDILRFHAVYWPAFLMSAGLAPPSQVWAHGWLTVDGQKMSKSLGNFIAPGPIVEAVGADVLRYYLMRDIAFGQDGDFSHHSLFARYHGELGNGLGNLLNRVVPSFVKAHFAGQVPAVDLASLPALDRELMACAERAAQQAAEQLRAVRPSRALEAIWELVLAANKYIDRTEPWNLAKSGDKPRLGQVLYVALEALRYLGIMLWPFMPDKCDALLAQLGLPPPSPEVGRDQWPARFGELLAGTLTRPGKPLFPRFEKDEEARLMEALVPKPPAAAPEQAASPSSAAPADSSGVSAPAATKPAVARDLSPKNDVDFDDFMKLDLRVGEVKVAEKVPKSRKLLRLEVDLGPLGVRQIVAGIAAHYAPEELVGKRIAVLANLPPRKLMGLESQGMVLAAGDGDMLSVLSPQRDVPLGSTIA